MLLPGLQKRALGTSFSGATVCLTRSGLPARQACYHHQTCLERFNHIQIAPAHDECSSPHMPLA